MAHSRIGYAVLGIDTKELKRPAQALLAAGAIRTEGQRRGTKYFPAEAAMVATKKAKGRKAETMALAESSEDAAEAAA